jgi:hypothetical protein
VKEASVQQVARQATCTSTENKSRLLPTRARPTFSVSFDKRDFCLEHQCKLAPVHNGYAMKGAEPEVLTSLAMEATVWEDSRLHLQGRIVIEGSVKQAAGMPKSSFN